MGEENKASEIKFIDPAMVIDQFGLSQGATVADFGCGTGYFSLPLAKKVGPGGMVYSLDILPSKIEAMESQIKAQNISNIIARRANVEMAGGSKLEPMSVDWVVMKDMLFQNKNKAVILEEARRILKSGGKAVIVEWKKSETQIGPESSLRISKEELLQLAGATGWQVEREISAGDFHYGIILIKTDA